MPDARRARFASPIGVLLLEAQGDRLRGLRMIDDPSDPLLEGAESGAAGPFLDDVRARLDDYFAERPSRFDLPLLMEGTDFQRRVWGELLKIPHGETISYAELARRVGDPKATRAVGSANGRNPIAVIVPCHRVISADGRLGGFGGGLDRKLWLLRHEARVVGREAPASWTRGLAPAPYP
ncbi:methylated-DNA--[protein]-cysteine S-methyltransferase [Paludisphaera sp.]|uniref:methylated-DNA--[protein]-cysteine S-methyltransferase n=1 Tax=Paludisphaera sp. TaxID=2017432 RepID=UPI00301DEC12